MKNSEKDPSEVILRKRDLKASQKGRVNIEKVIYEHEKKKVCNLNLIYIVGFGRSYQN